GSPPPGRRSAARPADDWCRGRACRSLAREAYCGEMSAPLRPWLPALGVLVTAAERALRRFPLVVLAAVVAAAAGMLLVNSGDDEERYARVLIAATLGLPLVFALTLTAERRFAAQD